PQRRPFARRGCAGRTAHMTDPGDENMLELLRAVQDGDDRGEPTDSEILAARLAWPPDVVASRLAEARNQMLVWGSRTGGKGLPRYADLELTVQGRRFIAAAEQSSED